MLMELANKILRLSRELRLSQSEIARQAGVSPSAVSKWVRGESVPGLFEAAALARVLRVPIAFLADDTLDDPPTGPDPDEAFVLRAVRALRLDPEEAVRRLSRDPSPMDAYAPGEEIQLEHVRTVDMTGHAANLRREERHLARKRTAGSAGPDPKPQPDDEGPDAPGVPGRVRR